MRLRRLPILSVAIVSLVGGGIYDSQVQSEPLQNQINITRLGDRPNEAALLVAALRLVRILKIIEQGMLERSVMSS